MPADHPPPTAALPPLLPQLLRLLDHVLEQEPQARARLRPHAGKVVALRVAGFELPLAVDADGRLRQAGTDSSPDAEPMAPHLSLDVDVAELLRGRLRGQPLALAGVRIAGDAEFAQAVSWLVAHVRWDAEDDLARYVGDVAAHRLARTARAGVGAATGTARRLEGDLRAWLAGGPRALVTRGEFGALAAQVAQLRDAVARADKRIELLQRRARG